jgi:hypothetical protein
MIVEVLNKNFSEVRVAALYKESETSTNNLMYHACKNNAIITDFLEYDLRAKVRKNLYNNFFKLNYLSKDLRDKLQNKLEDLDLYNSLIVPTTSASETNDIASNYFGSIQLNSETSLFILDIPENIKYVEFYTGNNEDLFKETKLTYGNETYSEDRVIKVTFGPEVNKNYTALDYSKYMDEIYSRKILALLTTGSDVTINLVQNCWDNNENANRNKADYTLRNNDFYNSKQYLSLFGEDKSGFLEDLRSGTILSSTKEIKKLESDNNIAGPILRKKLEKAKKNRENKIYNPRVTYHKGDKVFFNGSCWYSISNFNNNNIPSLSPKNWLINNLIEDYYFTIVENKPFTVDDNNEEKLLDAVINEDKCILTKSSTFNSIDCQIDNSIYTIDATNDSDLVNAIYIGTSFDDKKPISEFKDENGNQVLEATLYGDVLGIKSLDQNLLADILEGNTIFIKYKVYGEADFDVNVTYYDEDGNKITDEKTISEYNNQIEVTTDSEEKGLVIANSLLGSNKSNYQARPVKFSNKNTDNNKSFYFKVNDGEEIEENVLSKNLIGAKNNISIRVATPKYVVTVIDESGVFEVSSNRIIVNKGEEAKIDFYISRDFDTGDADDINYSFNKLRITRGKKTDEFKNTSNDIIQSDNTSYDLDSFSFCSSTYSERLEREVYTIKIAEIETNVEIRLFAQEIK